MSDSRIVELQKQLNAALKELREEAERIKTTYPIFDLLAAKQAEVERMKKALNTIPREHPERKTAEAMVKSHIIERDELRRIAEASEERLKRHLDKIHATYLLSTHNITQKVDAEQPSAKNKPHQWIRIPEY